MKVLSNTYLFQMYNNATKIGNIFKNYKHTDKVSEEILKDSMDIIKKYNFPTKNKIISEMVDGNIICAFNSQTLNLPISIPSFLTLKQNDKVEGGMGLTSMNNIMAVVNLTRFASINFTTNIMRLDLRKFFALLQSGLFLRGCMESWSAITKNFNLKKIGCDIYQKIFSKVLDKKYAINLNPEIADAISYFAAKFFQINLMEQNDSEIIKNTAYSCCRNETARSKINTYESYEETDTYTNLSTFVDFLNKAFPSLKSMTIRQFCEDYMRLYGQSTIFALEFFPAFATMLGNVLVGCNINNEYVIDSLIGKKADNFYIELSAIVTK